MAKKLKLAVRLGLGLSEGLGGGAVSGDGVAGLAFGENVLGVALLGDVHHSDETSGRAISVHRMTDTLAHELERLLLLHALFEILLDK